MLTGSVESQSKMKQVRALIGKLKDGKIRGRRARQAAREEIERLLDELNVTRGGKEASTRTISQRRDCPEEEEGSERTVRDVEAQYKESEGGGLLGSEKSTASTAAPSKSSVISPSEFETLSSTQNGKQKKSTHTHSRTHILCT